MNSAAVYKSTNQVANQNRPERAVQLLNRNIFTRASSIPHSIEKEYFHIPLLSHPVREILTVQKQKNRRIESKNENSIQFCKLV